MNNRKISAIAPGFTFNRSVKYDARMTLIVRWTKDNQKQYAFINSEFIVVTEFYSSVINLMNSCPPFKLELESQGYNVDNPS